MIVEMESREKKKNAILLGAPHFIQRRSFELIHFISVIDFYEPA